MTVIHIFTEEQSLKNVLTEVLPKVLPKHVYFNIYSHQGKQDLEKALKTTLPSISKTPGAKILITRDQDNDDCIELKKRIFELVNDNCLCEFSIRIICKELEAWFLGDMNAIESAYPKFKADQHINKAEFREVDKIQSPSRQLLNIIPDFSKSEYLPKLEVSECISPFLQIDNNKSVSFNHTITAIKKLAS